MNGPSPATNDPADETVAVPDRWGERLPRRLGLLSAIAVVIGSTIGSGIFRTPAEVAHRLDDLGLFMGAWALGSVIALCGALTFAELSAMMPRSGGLYVYLREAYGPLYSFLFGWAQLLVLRPAAFGAIAQTSAAYLWRTVGVDAALPLEGLPLSLEQVTAAVLIVVVGVINYRGVQLGALVQNVSTLLKMGALVLLCIFGLYVLASGRGWVGAAAPVPPTPELALYAAFGLAMIPILWSYDGWSDVGYMAGEIRDPQRNLPRAFILGTGVVAGLYLVANAAYLSVVPLREMPQSELIAADVARSVLGGWGVVFVSGAIALSTFGTLNGSMMTGPRIFFAMAEDGLFFRRLAAVQPRFGTPGASIALAVALGAVFVCVRNFAQLADLFVIGIWPFYALGVLALFTLRRRDPDAERPYRTWGYPWVPLLFLASTVFLLGSVLFSKPWLVVWNLVVILSGIPIYLMWTTRARP